jgi:hypothetical protein
MHRALSNGKRRLSQYSQAVHKCTLRTIPHFLWKYLVAVFVDEWLAC